MGTLSLLRAQRTRDRRKQSPIHSPIAGEILESRLLLSAETAVDPFEQHFDFGTATSPAAIGYTPVPHGAVYSAAAGFGWTQGTVDSRDRGAGYGDVRIRDFNFTVQGTFVVDVPVGIYSATLTMGDGLAVRDEMGVILEGTLVDSVTTLAGLYETRTYTTTVTDGQLTLTLEDLGGANTLVMINSLNLVQIGGDPAGPQVLSASPDEEAVGLLDRFTLTFNKEVNPVTFTTAAVTLSGPDGPITPTAVTQLSEDTFEITFDPQTTLGDYTLTLPPVLADLEGNLMNQDGDDVNGEPLEDGFELTVRLVEAPTFEQTYDFGTASSPVAADAVGVSEADVYSAAEGFGWTDGAIASRDRGSLHGDDLTRDFNVMTAGTFVVDVPAAPALYDVTITLGDALAARDEVGLYLEGTLLDTVSTAYGAYETRTFQVTVSDGQLTLLVEDLGGADTVAVINSLHVRHVQDLVEPEPPDGDEWIERWIRLLTFVLALYNNRDLWLSGDASPYDFFPPGYDGETLQDDLQSVVGILQGAAGA